MSRDEFEQRTYVAKVNAGGSALDAAGAAWDARQWYELTYRKAPKGKPPVDVGPGKVSP